MYTWWPILAPPSKHPAHSTFFLLLLSLFGLPAAVALESPAEKNRSTIRPLSLSLFLSLSRKVGREKKTKEKPLRVSCAHYPLPLFPCGAQTCCHFANTYSRKRTSPFPLGSQKSSAHFIPTLWRRRRRICGPRSPSPSPYHQTIFTHGHTACRRRFRREDRGRGIRWPKSRQIRHFFIQMFQMLYFLLSWF